MPFNSRVSPAVLAGAALWLWPATQAAASVESFSGTLPSCQTAGGTADDCTGTIYYSTDLASSTTGFISGDIAGENAGLADFQTAFNNWNAANGSMWTLVDGGVLNLDLGLALGGAIGSGGGGVDPIIVTISDYNQTSGQPSLDQLAWTQALFTDYTPTAGLVASPVITLDTYSLSEGSAGSDGAFQNSCEPIPGQSPGANNTSPAVIGATESNHAYCDPIYPFQYGSEYAGDTIDDVPVGTGFFYDAPNGPWPDADFRGTTLLSTVTFDTNGAGTITNRVLTVYQGIDYGFSLTVPEAGSGWLIGPTLPILALLRRRQRRHPAHAMVVRDHPIMV